MAEKLTTWEAVKAWWHAKILACGVQWFPALLPVSVKKSKAVSLPRLKRLKKKPVHRNRRNDFPTKWE